MFVLERLSGRYECMIATDPFDRKTCLAIRQEVFGDELKRQNKDSPAHEDQFDQESIFIACRDSRSNKIIGTVRLTLAIHFKGHEKYFQEYALHLFSDQLLDRIYIASRLVILKKYRRSSAAFGMVLKCYEQAIKQDIPLSVIVCEPNLYPMYRGLGYRPLSRVLRSPFGGFRLPLVLLVHDYKHLKSVGSAFLSVAKKQGSPDNPEGMAWYLDRSSQQGGAELGFEILTHDQDKTPESQLLKDLNQNARDTLLNKGVAIRCQLGDMILARGAGGRNLGIVKKGAVEVMLNDRIVALLGEGDLFGETAFLLDVPRTADLITAEDGTEIIQLSFSAIEKLSDRDRALFWKNMATILAKRHAV